MGPDDIFRPDGDFAAAIFFVLMAGEGRHYPGGGGPVALEDYNCLLQCLAAVASGAVVTVCGILLMCRYLLGSGPGSNGPTTTTPTNPCTEAADCIDPNLNPHRGPGSTNPGNINNPGVGGPGMPGSESSLITTKVAWDSYWGSSGRAVLSGFVGPPQDKCTPARSWILGGVSLVAISGPLKWIWVLGEVKGPAHFIPYVPFLFGIGAIGYGAYLASGCGG